MEGGGGGSRELQCVGKLQISKPKPVGFLCGSIPVPTDNAFHSFSSALIPSPNTVSGAPRYRVLPTETDLNRPPHIPSSPEKFLPVSVAVQSRLDGGLPSDVSAVTPNLSRKCEALAVSGVVEYGDEVDVIAPADILKQVFKIPYSKARLSIAVQRIGQTLVLNPGPDVEEGEKYTRRHKNQTKSADQSLFLNFAMHSVRVEACDCPPTHRVPTQEASPSSSVLPGANAPQFAKHDGSKSTSGYAESEPDGLLWGNKNNKRKKGSHEAVEKVSQVGEKPRSTMQESEKHKRASTDGFLRVLLWQFHNFRMLLGSDLMLFSNEKYVSVSLHLWDVTREITPLTWLEAWLDNVMASVPELAICYHQNGVVQGYELLKTDDIFLLKGISEDGTPAFHPYVVQQNGLSVLRFIQENCKQEPGAYWLYKNAGEDVIQLFDLSAISKNHTSGDRNDCTSSMPSIVHNGRSDCLQSLGTLLYRIAHRLSLSVAPDNRAKCAKFIKQCLAFLEEPDHLVVRSLAHEQFARIFLNHGEDLELSSEAFPVDCEVTCSGGEERFLFCLDNDSDSRKYLSSTATENASPSEVGEIPEDLVKYFPIKTTLEVNASCPGAVIEPGIADSEDSSETESMHCEEELSRSTVHLVQTVARPISSKLGAIHHVSQAIKSLREARRYQFSESETEQDNEIPNSFVSPVNPFVCGCGDPDCIEVCDIREWLPTSKFDQKLWKLVLLLGESYLALGHACKEDGQMLQALKAVELACSVYGSMPQQLVGSKFISSMMGHSTSQVRSYDGDDTERVISIPRKRLTSEQSSSALFWANAWTLVGDIFAENCMVKGNDVSKEEDSKSSTLELKVSPEVMEEVKRLEKRLGQYVQNCSLCSLVNCSCKSDRTSSGSNASSRSGDTLSTPFGRKQNKRPVKSKNPTRNAARETVQDKDGGIFKYLRSPLVGDVEYLLSVAVISYKEAKNALGGLSTGSEALHQSVTKKIGWASNELGRFQLKMQELKQAEVSFADAIKAFREVSDHTNVILIYCNLGHGRRALAEALVTKIEDLKLHNQALESAKLEYSESLRYYEAARSELNTAGEESGLVPSGVMTDVHTQFANTYLRLGMLLAKDVTAEVHGNDVGEDRKKRKHKRKHEISAGEAMSRALSIYESLGRLCEQQAAYTCLHLARYQRDCCLKFLELGCSKSGSSKGESNSQHQVKHYTSVAERNWQKAADFYRPETHANIYLAILTERSALLLSLSSPMNSNEMLESAMSFMLEGRKVPEALFDSLKVCYPDEHSKFWAQLQMVLKRMLSYAMSGSTNISGDTRKLRELYAKSLKSSDFSHLNAIYSLWTS